MTTFIDHDVAIVSVFDLQDVADDAVGGQTFREVQPSLLELGWGLVAVPFQEVLVEIDLESFTKLISTVWVRYAFNEPTQELVTSRAIADALVRYDIEVKIALFENLLEKLDDLQG